MLYGKLEKKCCIPVHTPIHKKYCYLFDVILKLQENSVPVMREINVTAFSTEYGTFEFEMIPKSSNFEVNASFCDKRLLIASVPPDV